MENEQRGILYPGLQKFYSALSNLEQFDVNQDFFDNIRNLDNFFSEFRSVTLAIQKSLAHTDHLTTYNSLRDKWLINDECSWMNNVRTTVVHEHPFELVKKYIITVYQPSGTTVISSKQFSVEDDKNIDEVISNIQAFLTSTGLIEIHYSVEYIFSEKDSDYDIFDNIVTGIKNMISFLRELYNTVDDRTRICDELWKRIENIYVYKKKRDILFIDDYVFYPNKSLFERGSRIEMVQPFPTGKNFRAFLSQIGVSKSDDIITVFKEFSSVHVLIYSSQNKRIAPTIITINSDDSFNLDMFDSSIRTTLYRKVNQIASKIETEKKIEYVIFVSEFICHHSFDDYKMDYQDRNKLETNEDMLGCMLVTKDCKTYDYHFLSSKIDDKQYVSEILNSVCTSNVPLFLLPISAAFKKVHGQQK